MDLLDSDIFILHLRYPRDSRSVSNKRLLEWQGGERATTIFNILEVCGVLSFNLTSEALMKLYTEFGRRYHVAVLFPPQLGNGTFLDLVSGTFGKITQKMTYGDAQILWLAERYTRIDRLITWNTKDYKERTDLEVITPEEWEKTI